MRSRPDGLRPHPRRSLSESLRFTLQSVVPALPTKSQLRWSSSLRVTPHISLGNLWSSMAATFFRKTKDRDGGVGDLASRSYGSLVGRIQRGRARGARLLSSGNPHVRRGGARLWMWNRADPCAAAR